MQASDAAELLAFIAAFDNRKVTKETAVAWAMAITREVPTMTVDVAREIVMDHFATSAEYFTVGLLLDGVRRRLRLTAKAIADDVRSAKARGLIGDHDPRVPLPADVAARLAAARANDREVAPAEIEGGSWELPKQIGVKHESH